MSDLTNKDAEQDTKLAVLESTLENSVRRIEMVHQRIDRTNEDLEKLTDRIRVLERWVAGSWRSNCCCYIHHRDCRISRRERIMEQIPDDEWYCEINMGIDEVRALYYHLCYAIETWLVLQGDPPKNKSSFSS